MVCVQDLMSNILGLKVCPTFDFGPSDPGPLEHDLEV
jgi:hypothetical protein